MIFQRTGRKTVSQRIGSWRVWVLLLALATFAKAGPNLPLPQVVVGSTPTPPVIDGTVNLEEWRYAARLTGFITLSTPAPADIVTVFYLTWDQDNLYIAFHGQIPGMRPHAMPLKRDGGVWGGDSIEIYIVPPWMKEGQNYQLVGNYHGNIFDCVRMHPDKPTKLDRSWNGRWQFKELHVGRCVVGGTGNTASRPACQGPARDVAHEFLPHARRVQHLVLHGPGVSQSAPFRGCAVRGYSAGDRHR